MRIYSWVIHNLYSTTPTPPPALLTETHQHVVIESLVRSGYLPFLALTETVTGYGILQLSNQSN